MSCTLTPLFSGEKIRNDQYQAPTQTRAECWCASVKFLLQISLPPVFWCCCPQRSPSCCCIFEVILLGKEGNNFPVLAASEPESSFPLGNAERVTFPRPFFALCYFIFGHRRPAPSAKELITPYAGPLFCAALCFVRSFSLSG